MPEKYEIEVIDPGTGHYSLYVNGKETVRGGSTAVGSGRVTQLHAWIGRCTYVSATVQPNGREAYVELRSYPLTGPTIKKSACVMVKTPDKTEADPPLPTYVYEPYPAVAIYDPRDAIKGEWRPADEDTAEICKYAVGQDTGITEEIPVKYASGKYYTAAGCVPLSEVADGAVRKALRKLREVPLCPVTGERVSVIAETSVSVSDVATVRTVFKCEACGGEK